MQAPRWLLAHEGIGPTTWIGTLQRTGSSRKPTSKGSIAPSGRFAIEAEIADAIAFTEASPFPDISPLHTNVFAGE